MARKFFKNLGESIDLTKFVFPPVIKYYNCCEDYSRHGDIRPLMDLLTYQKSSGGLACKDPFLVYSHNKISTTDFDNVPISGIKINDIINQIPITGGRNLWYPHYNTSYLADITIEVEDPRGWIVSVCNALDLLKNNQIVNGELIGSYVYVWVDKCTIMLVNCESQLYQDLLNLRNLQSIKVDYTNPTVGQGYKLNSSGGKVVYYLGRFPIYTINGGSYPKFLKVLDPNKNRQNTIIAAFRKLPKDRHVFTDGERYYIVSKNKLEISCVVPGDTIPESLTQKYISVFKGTKFGSIPTGITVNARYVFDSVSVIEYKRDKSSIRRYLKEVNPSHMNRIFFVPTEKRDTIDCIHIGLGKETFKFASLKLYSDKLMYEVLPSPVRVDHPENLSGISIDSYRWESYESSDVDIISWNTGNGFNRADCGLSSGVSRNVIIYKL